MLFKLTELLGQVRSECLTCTFRASCCSARLSRAQVLLAFPGSSVRDSTALLTPHSRLIRRSMDILIQNNNKHVPELLQSFNRLMSARNCTDLLTIVLYSITPVGLLVSLLPCTRQCRRSPLTPSPFFLSRTGVRNNKACSECAR